MNSALSPLRPEAILRNVRERLYPLVSSMRAKSTLVEGRLKGSDLPARILFVQNCLFNSELIKRSFSEPPRVVREQTVYLPLLARFLRTHARDYDLCVAVLPKQFAASLRSLRSYEGQEDVRQIVDVSVGWQEMRRRFANGKRLRANNFETKSGLNYRISHDPADFDHFYRRMFVPLIQRRYGALGVIDSYDTMKAWFDKGHVLLVTKGDTVVAGALGEVQDGTLLFRRSGVLDGDDSHVKAGAQLALYYFQLRYAVDSGLKAFDALKSAPFLNDGVFRTKVEWGAVTLPDDEADRTVLYFLSNPAECQAAFFEINPTIVKTDNGLAALVGRRESGAASASNTPDPLSQLVLGVDRHIEIRWPPAATASV